MTKTTKPAPTLELAGTIGEPEGKQEFIVEVMRPAVRIGPTAQPVEAVLQGYRGPRYKGLVVRPDRWERWRIYAETFEKAKEVVRSRFFRLVDHRWISGEGVA